MLPEDEGVEEKITLQVEGLEAPQSIVSDEPTLQRREVSLRSVIAESVARVELAAVKKGILVTQYFDSRLPALDGDAARLEQVTEILLDNAIKFARERGRVDVIVSVVEGGQEPTLRLVVRDDGRGILPEHLPHLFEIFAPTRHEREDHPRGELHLGLALAKHLVELHGGSVAAESAGLGSGATFTVILPLRSQPVEISEVRVAPPRRDRSTPNPSLRGIRLLVVDDDDDTRELVEAVFLAVGAEVVSAHSVDEALAFVKANEFDLIISDIGMPVRDGHDLIHAVRALPAARGSVPAIALSAFHDRGQRAKSLEAGFSLYLTKPFEHNVLLEAVKDLTSNRVAASSRHSK